LQIFHSYLKIEVVTKGCIFTKSGLDLNLCGLFFEAKHFYYQAVLIPAVVRTKIRDCLGEFGGWWSLSLGGYGVRLVTSPRSDDPV
jgi:hypothetical protein